jgi:aarF domain-containing kinase
MTTLHAFSPLLRRGGAVPSWTCRACERAGTRIQPSAIARGVRGQRGYAKSREGVEHVGAVKIEAEANAVKPPPSPVGGAGKAHGKSGPKSKRRRRVIIAGGALTIGAAAVAFSDDAKHAYTATQRSYRVLETLVLNIREYVHFLSGYTRFCG